MVERCSVAAEAAGPIPVSHPSDSFHSLMVYNPEIDESRILGMNSTPG